MEHTSLCADELARLKALEQSGLMDSSPEREFDELTRLDERSNLELFEDEP